MDAKQPFDPLDDLALDREIQAALDVDPSPEFIARVRLRVASKTRSKSWFSLRPLAGLATIAAAVGAAVFLMRMGEAPRRAIEITPRDVGTAEANFHLPRQTGPAPAVGPAEAGPHVPNHAWHPPVVLLPPEEVQAFRQLAAAINEGRLTLGETDHSDGASVASPDIVINEDGIPVPVALNIEPLVIEPITQ
jgi:hypothetical protein